MISNVQNLTIFFFKFGIKPILPGTSRNFDLKATTLRRNVKSLDEIFTHFVERIQNCEKVVKM